MGVICRITHTLLFIIIVAGCGSNEPNPDVVAQVESVEIHDLSSNKQTVRYVRIKNFLSIAKILPPNKRIAILKGLKITKEQMI